MRRSLLVTIAVAALGVSAASSCTKRGDLDGVAEAVKTALAATPPRTVARDVWATAAKFYAARGGAPAWVDAKKPVKRSAAAIASLDAARHHALNPADYDAAALLAERAQLAEDEDKKNGPSGDRDRALAAFEVHLTTALLALGHDVAVGRTTPGAIDPRWKARRTPPDVAHALEGAIDGNFDAWLDVVRPTHREYAQLQQALVDLIGVQQRGGWPRVDSRALARGRSNAAVAPLRQRLAAAGYLDESAGTSTSRVFDDTVASGVKAFQEHHGLKATGVVDPTTAAAMNVTVEQRIAQVGLNLERWRWMPDDFGARHLIVNIPRYRVIAREAGKPVLDIRVVVGKVGNETPVFSGDMQTVVFSPYWNIPDTILAGETAPSVLKDRNYLARNNIEVLRVSSRGAERVDPDDVDWNDTEALKQLSVRQRPGAQNALGHVKFLFPNPYDVYLHDTPADSLFARQGRALSHGCVRVEEPEKLANYILRGYAEWPEDKILTAMHSGEERHVKLNASIPVHIVYFTAWVDDDGGMHFQHDVYGHDTRQLQRSRARSGPQRIAGGPFEASAVVSVPGGRGVLVADDDSDTALVWMALDERGRQQGRIERVPTGTTLVDPEALTFDGVHYYVVGSQSKPNGPRADGLMRFRFDAVQRRIVERASVSNLKGFLAARVPELAGVNPDRGTDEELNIEGLAWDPAASRLLLGLRAPVVGGDALVIPLKLRDPAGPFAGGNLMVDGAAIRLALGGAGIRSLEHDAASGAFWVITGASLNDEVEDFRLLEWRTVAGTHQFSEIARYPRTLKPEGITRAMLDQAHPRVLVFDVGLYTSID